MPVDFPLESLDNETFEQLAVALGRTILGSGVTVFGKGPDGGREATYQGPVLWSNTTGFGDDSWDGYVVVQAKQRALFDPDPVRNHVWLKAQIKSELDAWVKPESRRGRFPEYLVFVTNARLSAAQGGGVDSIEDYLRGRWDEDLRSRGLKGWKVWHRDQVVSLLIQSEGVRRAFPAFLTSPNDQLLTRFEQLAEFFEPKATQDLLVAHALAALRNEQWVNFGEAGDDSRRSLHEVIVDLPIRGPSGARGRALTTLIRGGERVLKASLVNPAVPRWVVLTGAPGNGKSTLSRYIVQLYRLAFMSQNLPSSMQTIARGTRISMDRIGLSLPRQQRWPMRLDLAEWASADPRHGSSLIKWLAYKVGERADRAVSTADMRRWLREWPWLVILDGLDEVTSPLARREIIGHIEEFIDQADAADADVFMVVTTRPGGYTDELPSEHFAERELDYLSKEEAISYGHLVTAGRLADDQDRRNEVLARFRLAVDDPATARLLKTPLQVLIITFILEHLGGSLPATRYGLFWSYYETLFQREANKNNHLARTLAARSQEVTYLHEVVGALLQERSEGGRDSQARMSLQELRSILDARLRAIGYDDNDMERHRLTEEILNAATRRLVLLIPGGVDANGEETVTFEVRSLQELMAARRLSQGADNQVLERLRTLAPSPHWRNAWVFMAGRLFAEPDESRWSLVTNLLSAIDTSPGWPGWFIPVAPGLAADLLDDGLAVTKPKWQKVLLDIALRSLSEPLPVDMVVVSRGLAACGAASSYRNVIMAALKRAFSGTESSRYAATQILRNTGLAPQGVMLSQTVPALKVRVGRTKGTNRLSARELLEPAIKEWMGDPLPQPMVDALAELGALRLIEVGGEVIGVRPKELQDWKATVAALLDDDRRDGLEFAFRSVDPSHWRLLHFVSTEVFPAFARQPLGNKVLP